MNEPDNHNQHPLYRDILRVITEGNVVMKPRWHFVLKTTLLAMGVVIAFFAVVYLASFVVFVLRHTGASAAPAFGMRGWYAFLVAMPWFLVVLLVIFIVILEILVRRYSFGYRRPLMYSALAVVGLIVVIGYTVSTTPLHPVMYRYMERHQVPVARRLYQHYDAPSMKSIHPGIIVTTTESGFLLSNRRGETLMIVITPHTQFIPPHATFGMGEYVVVFGDRSYMNIEAVGVKKAPRPCCEIK